MAEENREEDEDVVKKVEEFTLILFGVTKNL